MGKVFAGLFVVFVIAILGLDYSLTQTEPEEPQVVGLPPVSVVEPIAAYKGPHPSLISRPDETFDFPIRLGEIGPVQPLFAGPLQYPFLCNTHGSRLGQPLVDNHKGWGMPVYALGKKGEITETIIGYSKDCLIPTTARYYYKQKETGKFLPLSLADNDIDTTVINGKEIDFVVRLETGVINRYLYMIAVLKGADETLATPNASHWNKKLIYQFRGGVGIGYRQGKVRPNVIFKRRAEQLAQGYAVLYSSGTQTSNHYNMWVSEDVSLRLKRQFMALYGTPDYTVGIGGSGGAIQQYLIAQNNPNVIDAIIAEYSYPDMVTQTLYAMDCELIEYFFDVVDRDNPRWQDWPNRQLVQGMNANNNDSEFKWLQRLSQLREGVLPHMSSGETECVNGWRGLTPLVNNPNFYHHKKYFADDVYDQVKWTHWQDLKQFYGTDAKGYGQSIWDNVGVQYGLHSLLEEKITPDEFIHLNASIGGWKSPEEMEQERYWFLLGDGLFPLRVSVWSHQNMRLGSLEQPAKRSVGNVDAIEGAYRSGHVFLGKLDIPIIDVRHYLEDDLDMHHLIASFSVRKRMQREQGHADNQLIWVSKKPHNPEPDAFLAIDEWMQNIKDNPSLSIVANKPSSLTDRCIDEEGDTVASGDSVWDGQWNNLPSGDCTAIYPGFGVTRSLAGADVAGDVLSCHRQPVTYAMSRGLYGDIDMSAYSEQLERIFPDGVCDYRLGDAARPLNLLPGQQVAVKLPKDQPLVSSEYEPVQEPPKTVISEPIEVSFDTVNDAVLPTQTKLN